MYVYNITNIRVIDGDTIEATLQLGLNISIRRKIRLYDVDTWEMRGVNKEKGKLAKKALKNYLKGREKSTSVQTIKDKSGKYGRLLGIIHCHGFDVNKAMSMYWSKTDEQEPD